MLLAGVGHVDGQGLRLFQERFHGREEEFPGRRLEGSHQGAVERLKKASKALKGAEMACQ